MPLIQALELHIRVGEEEESSQTNSLILRFLEAGLRFQTEVEVRASVWLFCCFNLQVEPQFPTLSFY